MNETNFNSTLDYATPEANTESRRRREQTSFGASMIVLAACGTTFIALPSRELDLPELYGWFLWLVVLIAWANRALARKLNGDAQLKTPEGPRWWRRPVIALLILTFVLGTRADRCPHATYVLLGPIPLRFGEGCRNQRHYRNVIERLRL